MRKRLRLLYGAASVATGTYVAVFRLPFLFPPTQRLVSASYVFGFNNALAVIAMAVILAALTVRGVRVRSPNGAQLELLDPRDSERTGVSLWLFAAVALTYTALTWLLYRYAQGPHAALTWESRPFIYRVKLMEAYHLRPYLDFHSEYGPGLILAPLYMHRVLSPFGVSVEGAYFVCHLLLNLAGLGCLLYVLRSLNASRAVKSTTFVVVAAAAFGPWMGLNGGVLRYLGPYASVLFAHRTRTSYRRSGSTAAFFASALITVLLLWLHILISADIALAFAVASATYALMAGRTDGAALGAGVAALLFVGIISWLVLPPMYFDTFLAFARGANNLPLLPAPHLVVYVTTLLLLVPALLIVAWPGTAPDAALWGALGILTVALIPGAFGRCDPPHVLYYGLGATMLAMPWLAQISPRAWKTFAVVYASVFIALGQVVNVTAFFNLSPTDLARAPRASAQIVVAGIRNETADRDRGYLSRLDKYPRLGLPFATFGYDNDAEAYLLARGRVRPDYYVATTGVLTSGDLARKIADVSRHEYILIGAGYDDIGSADPCQSSLAELRRWFPYRVRLDCKHVNLDPAAELSRYIRHNYRAVERAGTVVVMRRVGTNLTQR